MFLLGFILSQPPCSEFVASLARADGECDSLACTRSPWQKCFFRSIITTVCSIEKDEQEKQLTLFLVLQNAWTGLARLACACLSCVCMSVCCLNHGRSKSTHPPPSPLTKAKCKDCLQWIHIVSLVLVVTANFRGCPCRIYRYDVMLSLCLAMHAA